LPKDNCILTVLQSIFQFSNWHCKLQLWPSNEDKFNSRQLDTKCGHFFSRSYHTSKDLAAAVWPCQHEPFLAQDKLLVTSCSDLEATW
ncbi:hypothetical protein A2U01_0017535, partial [Trifolium medium]|nr:hypothetical protein [Trifolium medium]